MIKSNLLYNTVIENDGSFKKEPTFLGAVLLAIAGSAVGFALALALGYIIAIFK